MHTPAPACTHQRKHKKLKKERVHTSSRPKKVYTSAPAPKRKYTHYHKYKNKIHIHTSPSMDSPAPACMHQHMRCCCRAWPPCVNKKASMQTSKKIIKQKQKQTNKQTTNKWNQPSTQTHKQTQANIQFTTAQICNARCQNTCVLDMYFPKIDTKNTTNIRKTLKYQTNTLSAHFVQHHTLTFAELLPRRYDSWTLVFPNFVKLLMGKKLWQTTMDMRRSPIIPAD